MNLSLDVSLEHARALHRVWRALNDGACPSCRKIHNSVDMIHRNGDIQCPSCKFCIPKEEIDSIEFLFSPAMDGAMEIFTSWRKSREKSREI